MMNSKKMDIVSRDLISNLPDEIISHILSFLTTKDVGLTSVLSKRWRHVLAYVPTVDVNDSLYDPNRMRRRWRFPLRQNYEAFVDRVMALQGNAPLHKFSLSCKIGDDPCFVNAWIHKALERGVLYLELSIVPCYSSKYMLPPKVLTSKTLVTLKLEANTIDVREVSLPKLKTLHIDGVEFDDKSGVAFSKLISGCHALEELVVINVTWEFWESFSVSNPNLKRVTIFSDNDEENPKSVSFDTPNLLYLKYTDIVAVKYPEANMDSVIEAKLDLQVTPDEVGDARDCVEFGEFFRWPQWTGMHRGYVCRVCRNALNFLMGIRNVKILYLSAGTLEVLTFCCKEIPVFNNLIHLTIETDKEIQWASLPYLFENCPNLETLVFQGLYYRDTRQGLEDKEEVDDDIMRCWDMEVDDDTPICLSSNPVKVLEIFKFGEISSYRKKEMDLIKYFVETMPNLEQVVIHYDTQIDDDVSAVLSAIQRFEKVASTKCEIQVISDNISLVSTVHSSSSTGGLNLL